MAPYLVDTPKPVDFCRITLSLGFTFGQGLFIQFIQINLYKIDQIFYKIRYSIKRSPPEQFFRHTSNPRSQF